MVAASVAAASEVVAVVSVAVAAVAAECALISRKERVAFRTGRRQLSCCGVRVLTDAGGSAPHGAVLSRLVFGHVHFSRCLPACTDF